MYWGRPRCPCIGGHTQPCCATPCKLRDLREAGGQVLRLALVPLGHALTRLPIGNTGRARVSALAPMGPQPHIKRLIDGAMAAARLQLVPFLKKTALFRFGWNATFPTRFMVRPLLFAKDFQAGE